MYRQILCLIILWVFFSSFRGNAQRTLSGTVNDAATGQLLDAANVVVLRGDRTVAFTTSNEKGEFLIPLNVPADTLILSVSSMGYASFSERIGGRSNFTVRLVPSPIRLKEVTIRPGRIWGRSDTIRYDASKFLRENDKTVEDLMKRLPGIQVDDDGKIQYRYLKMLDLTVKDVIDRLLEKDVHNLEDVFLASLDTSGELYVTMKDEVSRDELER